MFEPLPDAPAPVAISTTQPQPQRAQQALMLAHEEGVLRYYQEIDLGVRADRLTALHQMRVISIAPPARPRGAPKDPVYQTVRYLYLYNGEDFLVPGDKLRQAREDFAAAELAADRLAAATDADREQLAAQHEAALDRVRTEYPAAVLDGADIEMRYLIRYQNEPLLLPEGETLSAVLMAALAEGGRDLALRYQYRTGMIRP